MNLSTLTYPLSTCVRFVVCSRVSCPGLRFCEKMPPAELHS